MPAPPGPPPIVAAVYCGPPGGAASETTAWGRSHFFRPTPGLSYPNPSPAVAAASSSTPIVCMELLQLPRSTAAGPRRLASDPTTGENACHPDYHCDRLRHGRVENSLDWKGCRWSLDRFSKGSFEPAPPDQTTNFCSDRRTFSCNFLDPALPRKLQIPKNREINLCLLFGMCNLQCQSQQIG